MPARDAKGVKSRKKYVDIRFIPFICIHIYVYEYGKRDETIPQVTIL